MWRDFVYVIVGGGVAAGYAALEFTKKGVSHGQLCIISNETVAPYERPALSKGFLFPEAPARLPGFHTCVGANEEKLTPNWYTEHGIELILGTRVISADTRLKTLLTATGDTITYKYLIIATGARALKLEEIGINGSNAENVCYLRDLADATKLVNMMRVCTGGTAIVIGGGYIGMECAASLVMNKIKVTMVFPGSYCMDRLFSPKIARYYEDFYKSKGVNFIKGTSLSSLVINLDGKVTGAKLKDGRYVHADMVVVGIGARPNTSLFEGQLTFENGGIQVNSQMQSSKTSVYAVGDIASFPVKLFGDTRRLEHVDAARKTAKHAVSAIMEPKTTPDFDYMPFFYSRVFSLSWQFYGDNVGEVVHFGDFSGTKFGAYWVNDNRLVGCFLEGGGNEDYVAIADAIRLKPVVLDLGELERKGVDFVLAVGQKPPVSPTVCCGGGDSSIPLKKGGYLWYAVSGIVVAASAAAFAYWYADSGSLYRYG
ncbi:putative monodehydroascorbate reductase (NADH) [Helianthus annuus]|uniref:monodehydroascorbate reductase (NADH) n=1 Tax=Helianthus annuus TaxID=4232 RepID=A0A251S779_HELAN|nr:monodehydroascorbate reductase 4, peroxisomal [Helianthus annuus]KAF5763876.1 putative monodehydroascorbate reductase (NADH) [Helianthus annuus]KAJ0472487.1 putative monodehydroascorbate reductase (NADH) [Helianthus annuus]KAJ0648088.1 putative monodehydroascorbate reductase (NADH) [Helianthus annuus]